MPPAELEDLLLTHPAVADVAVIGVADEEAGELPKAFLVKKPDVEVTADDINKFLVYEAETDRILQVGRQDRSPQETSWRHRIR